MIALLCLRDLIGLQLSGEAATGGCVPVHQCPDENTSSLLKNPSP
jgi:hypothetical protein